MHLAPRPRLSPELADEQEFLSTSCKVRELPDYFNKGRILNIVIRTHTTYSLLRSGRRRTGEDHLSGTGHATTVSIAEHSQKQYEQALTFSALYKPSNPTYSPPQTPSVIHLAFSQAHKAQRRTLHKQQRTTHKAFSHGYEVWTERHSRQLVLCRRRRLASFASAR